MKAFWLAMAGITIMGCTNTAVICDSYRLEGEWRLQEKRDLHRAADRFARWSGKTMVIAGDGMCPVRFGDVTDPRGAGSFSPSSGAITLERQYFPTSETLQAGLLHEFGHSIGFDHVESDEDAVMSSVTEHLVFEFTDADVRECQRNGWCVKHDR